MRFTMPATVLLASLLAAPLAAQNNVAPEPVPVTPQPATGAAPPAMTTPQPTTPAEAANTIEAAPAPVPQEREPEPEPVAISPDAAYPNGFADPADPFGNDLSLAQQQEGRGFNWGLLGLLGLLGLIPLFRRGGGRTTRTVYVDRDDPKRVLREERIEE